MDCECIVHFGGIWVYSRIRVCKGMRVSSENWMYLGIWVSSGNWMYFGTWVYSGMGVYLKVGVQQNVDV